MSIYKIKIFKHTKYIRKKLCTLTIMAEILHEIQTSLEQLLQELNVQNYKLHITKGSTKGDNYLGIITKVEVTENSSKNDSRNLKLIIKSAPQAMEFRNYIKIEILHEREVFMYDQVFPELIKFQQKLGLENIFNCTPKCYKTSTIAPYEHLIFEDMTAQGYVMKDRKSMLDLTHCLAVLRTYGRYHALAFALKVKEPDIYKRLSENTRELYFNNVSLENLCETIKGITDKIVKCLDQEQDKDMIDKINSFTKYPVTGLLDNLSIEAADGQVVFCHGDCWINNLLFRYHSSTDPPQVCILDWQLSRCASPAIDVSYFIFACIDKTIRDSHYDLLLDTYYSSLSSFLQELGCDTDIFSRKTFLNHLKKFSKYGLMMCLIVVPLFEAELEEIPDWTGSMEEGEREKMFTQERKSEKSSVTKLTNIVRDFISLGYL